MKEIRKRLTYANVVASLALFLAVAGGSAFAATQLAKNSVGTKQLKKNAVSTAKIKKNAVATAKLKKNAVTVAKIRNGAVSGPKLGGAAVSADKIADAAVTSGKIADGAVTGAKINPASTPFTRLVGTVSNNSTVAAVSGTPYLIGTYTQPVGEVNNYVPSVTVNFADSCKAPRGFQAYLLIDPAKPATPTPADLAGVAVIEDTTGGALTKQVGFAPGFGGFASLAHAAPSAATQRAFYVLPLGVSCSSGSGVNIQGAKVNVLGTPGG